MPLHVLEEPAISDSFGSSCQTPGIHPNVLSRSNVIRGLYSAAGGMQAMSLQQDATAQNLSHAMKPGYRREIIQFDSIGNTADMVAPRSSLHSDFRPGVHEFTGGSFDVAIDGPGFFKIQGPTGPLYTRSGVFQVNSLGQLVTPEGLAVQSNQGPISIPLNATFFEITTDGTIVADGAIVDQIGVTAFQNPNELQRVGSTYFQALPDSIRSTVNSEIRQGYRELGNTTLVHEMVQMISGARMFDAAQRALRQISETIQLNTHPRQ
jgi:flagellar basal body rod protein FlgG